MHKEVMRPRSYRLEVLSIFVAAGALAYACGCEVVSPAPVLTVTTDPEHEAQLDEAVALWNDAAGCGVLGRGPDLTVSFYTRDEWPGEPTWRGFYTDIGIGVLETTYEIERSTLVHELGHAIGLGHSMDRESVMWPIVGPTFEPNAEDVAQVPCP